MGEGLTRINEPGPFLARRLWGLGGREGRGREPQYAPNKGLTRAYLGSLLPSPPASMTKPGSPIITLQGFGASAGTSGSAGMWAAHWTRPRTPRRTSRSRGWKTSAASLVVFFAKGLVSLCSFFGIGVGDSLGRFSFLGWGFCLVFVGELVALFVLFGCCLQVFWAGFRIRSTHEKRPNQVRWS